MQQGTFLKSGKCDRSQVSRDAYADSPELSLSKKDCPEVFARQDATEDGCHSRLLFPWAAHAPMPCPNQEQAAKAVVKKNTGSLWKINQLGLSHRPIQGALTLRLVFGPRRAFTAPYDRTRCEELGMAMTNEHLDSASNASTVRATHRQRQQRIDSANPHNRSWTGRPGTRPATPCKVHHGRPKSFRPLRCWQL